MPKSKVPSIHTYYKINIHPAGINSSGIRWTACLPDGTRLRADTLQGIKQLIKEGIYWRKTRYTLS